MMKTLKEKIEEIKRRNSKNKKADIVLKVVFDSLSPEQRAELKGERGDIFRFDDLTSGQKREITGPAGKSLTFGDLTQEQKEELKSRLKGPPGEPFTFEKLTPEQKKELMGEKGEPGTKIDEGGLFERLAGGLKAFVADTLTKDFNEREKTLIEYLRKEMARIAQAMQRPMGGGLNRQSVLDLISGNAGGNFIREDLSAQCNGSLKVFVLANSYVAGSVQIMSTQFPIIYRPTTDFTESADKEITMTSEVGAPQTGQTLVAIYEKSV